MQRSRRIFFIQNLRRNKTLAAFLICEFFLLILSLTHWIEYEIRWLEDAQPIPLLYPSDSRAIFFLGSLLALILGGLPKVHPLTFFGLLALLAYYLFGFFSPQSVHTHLQLATYQFSVYSYLFGFILLATIVCSTACLKLPWLSTKKFIHYLKRIPL